MTIMDRYLASSYSQSKRRLAEKISFHVATQLGLSRMLVRGFIFASRSNRIQNQIRPGTVLLTLTVDIVAVTVSCPVR